MNKGFDQPGCNLIEDDIYSTECSHNRAYEFYAESINSPVKFYGKYCRISHSGDLVDCREEPSSHMGGSPREHKNNGIYNVETNAEPPFAKGGN